MKIKMPSHNVKKVAISIFLLLGIIVSAAAQLGTCPATQVRVTFKARVSGTAIGMQLDHASICMQSTTYNCISQPVELTFSGGHGFNIAAGASITSDWVNLTASSQGGAIYTQTLSNTGSTWSGVSLRNVLVTNGTGKVIVIMDWTTGANNSDASQTSCAGTNAYFLAASATYNQQSPAGSWTSQSTCEGVSIIESRPSSLPPNFAFGPLDLLGNAGTFNSGNFSVSTNYVSTGFDAGLNESFDYYQLVYYNPASLQSNIVIQQSWPTQVGQLLRGYPEVQYSPATLIAVNSLNTFTVNYAATIAGSLEDYQLAYDFFGWPTSTLGSGTPLFELFLAIYVPVSWGHTSNQSFNIDTVSPCSGSLVFYQPGTIPLISVSCVAADSQTGLNGIMDFKAILNIMKAHGLIVGTEFVGNVQLGVELRQNQSKVIIGKFVPTVN